MLRLNKNLGNLEDVFGIKIADIDFLFRITKRFHHNNTLTISQVLQRIWIDELISDNIKCWALFEFGRWCGRYESEIGGEQK